MGDFVLGPLEGHTSLVNSIAFSQDGKHIVSGSFDQTICVWDLKMGDVVLGPFEGHTGSINSVTSLQDGKHIVSGLSDKTDFFQDAQTRQAVGSPLKGLISSVPNDGLDHFNDNTRLEGGWILNSSSSLLFWVPPWNQKGLYWPRTLLVIGQGVHPIQLDLCNFVHGDSWHECKA